MTVTTHQQSPDAAKLWLPMRVASKPKVKATASIAVLGPSGVGKSHLFRQLVETHEEYRGRVLVWMTENSTVTYGQDILDKGWIHVCPIGDFRDANRQIDEAAEAVVKKSGQMPLLGGFDSVSGGADQHQAYMRRERPYTTSSGERYLPGEYGDLGRSIIEFMGKCKNDLAMNMLIICTTKFGSKEVCVEGNMTPDHFTRLTDVCLYMEAESNRVDASDDLVIEPAPFRTIGLDNKGNYFVDRLGKVTYVDRWFTTMNTGEVQAKGHRNLGLRERAVIGNVLDKVLGKKK